MMCGDVVLHDRAIREPAAGRRGLEEEPEEAKSNEVVLVGETRDLPPRRI
jgi:hypothetical protein